MADILKVRTERFSPHCHQVFSKLIPDERIRVQLVEISPTMRASVQGSHPSQSHDSNAASPSHHSPGSASDSSKSSSHHPQSSSVNSGQPSSSSVGHQSAELAHDERGRNPATGMRPSAPGLIMEGLTLRERIGRFYNDFSSRVPSSVNSGNEADVSHPCLRLPVHHHPLQDIQCSVTPR